MRVSLFLLAGLIDGLIGCGGAPFSLPSPADLPLEAGLTVRGPDPEADSGAVREADEAAGEAGDSSLGDASPPSPPDAQSPTPFDAAVCSPVRIQPADLCPGAPSAGFPDCYYRAGALPDAGGCSAVAGCFATPPACRCAETFNCACFVAAGVIRAMNCADIGGAPWVL
jgi:hypothetical protein